LELAKNLGARDAAADKLKEEICDGKEIAFKSAETYDPEDFPKDIFVYREKYEDLLDTRSRLTYRVLSAFGLLMLTLLLGYYWISPIFMCYIFYVWYTLPDFQRLYVEVRAITALESYERDSRPLPDRAQMPVLGKLYRLEYYVLINNVYMDNCTLHDTLPKVYESLVTKGLIDEMLENRDLVSSALYNELISRKTLNTQSPALATLASRCDYIDQSPGYMLSEGTSVSRSTVKLTSFQISSCSVPLFQAKVTSISFSTGTESTIQISQPSMPLLSRPSVSIRQGLTIPNAQKWRLVLDFVLLVIVCTGLILAVGSILYPGVLSDLRSDLLPATGMSDETFDDSLYYSYESCAAGNYSHPSLLKTNQHIENGWRAHDTLKTERIRSTSPIMDSQTSRYLRAEKIMMQWTQQEQDPEPAGPEFLQND